MIGWLPPIRQRLLIGRFLIIDNLHFGRLVTRFTTMVTKYFLKSIVNFIIKNWRETSTNTQKLQNPIETDKANQVITKRLKTIQSRLSQRRNVRLTFFH